MQHTTQRGNLGDGGTTHGQNIFVAAIALIDISGVQSSVIATVVGIEPLYTFQRVPKKTPRMHHKIIELALQVQMKNRKNLYTPSVQCTGKPYDYLYLRRLHESLLIFSVN